MASFPWFSFLRAKSNVPRSAATQETALKPDQSVKSISYESIADKFEELQADLAYADDLCGQANIQFAKYRTEIYYFKQNMAFLQQQLAHRTAMYNELHAQAERQRLDLKKERARTAQLQARLTTETNSLKAMTKQAQVAEQHLADAKFDIEYLKCTTPMDKPQFSPLVLNDETPLAPQPFVVVLVDGDAYGVSISSPVEGFLFLTLFKQWSPDLFTVEGVCEKSPGGLAAMQIKFEVTKYIRDQKGTIPFASKIITRVFQNFQGIISARHGALFSSRRGPQRRDWNNFSIQFTEKFPLFDFFDAGRGKERVDDKIRGIHFQGLR
jgi:hypothetical protein